MGKKRKSRRKDKNAEGVIDIEQRREARRRELREAAAAKRSKTGKKSLMDQMLEEAAFDDRGQSELVVPQRPPKKKKKKMPAPLKVMAVTFVIILCMLLYSIGNIISLRAELSDRQKTLEELQLEQEKLQQQVLELGSDEYIEQQAREWLRMAKSGEIIYSLDENPNADGNGNQQSQQPAQ